MDRRLFNAGLNYYVNVNDRVTHKLSVFNTQLSITKNKSAYYDYFPADDNLRDEIFQKYFVYNPAVGSMYDNGNGTLTKDDVSNVIIADTGFINTISTGQDSQLYINFLTSSLQKRKNYTECNHQFFTL
jgi:hypothetical protein